MLVLLAVILLARAARGQSQLKADLRRESECLERLVNTSSEGIFIADREGRAVLWNPALELMSGIDSRRANGRPVAELLSVIDWKNGERPIEGALDGIEVVSTGSTRPAPGEEGGKEFGIYCSPLPGGEGEVAGVLGIIRPSREIRATQSGRDDRVQTAAFSDVGDTTPSVSSVSSPDIPADPLELPVDAT
jgi:PAS domain S-box-containing protein